SPTGRGSRSRRCLPPSSEGSAPFSVRYLARSWSGSSESSPSSRPAMRPDSTSSSTAASSSSWWRSRRAVSPASLPSCAVAFGRQLPRHPDRWGAAMAEPLLRVERVSKRFGGLLAVDRVSFTAEAHRITALIGPNGAGKTTLFSMIAGFLAPSEGRIAYDGADIAGEPPHRLARRGLARHLSVL